MKLVTERADFDFFDWVNRIDRITERVAGLFGMGDGDHYPRYPPEHARAVLAIPGAFAITVENVLALRDLAIF
jgi:hypothetical protein